MTLTRVDLGSDPSSFDLGEGPVWDSRSATLSWVDITVGHVHVWHPESGQRWNMETGQHVGAAIPRESGGYVVALREGIALLDDSGLTWLAQGFLPKTHRLNDAKCDAQGRLWAGSTALDYGTEPSTLYRIEPDGTVTTVSEDIEFANGMGWSPDGKTYYLIDSIAQVLMAFDFNADEGIISNQRDLVVFDSTHGMPDGLAVDADGCLWVAKYGGSAVERYDSEGALMDRMEVVALNPTCPGFGGTDMKDLYVTTASQFIDKPSDDDGAILHMRAPVAGLPAHRFAG